MKVLHICAENDKHKPYEVLAFDPDLDDLPEDYLPKGYNITQLNTVELGDIDWPYFPSGTTFVSVASIQASE